MELLSAKNGAILGTQGRSVPRATLVISAEMIERSLDLLAWYICIRSKYIL